MSNRKTRRRVLQLSGAALVGSLAGCAGLTDSDGEETPEPTTEAPTTEPTSEPTTSAATETEAESESGYEMKRASEVESSGLDLEQASLPGTPADHTYARMGSDDASATVTLYGNWKCPYTQEFVLTRLDEVVETYVAPGDLAFEFRAIAYRDGEPFLGPDAPRAARAGLAVWDLDPKSYWSYFGAVFANQPQERYDWATADQLVEFAKATDIGNAAKVGQRLDANAYATAVQATVESAAEVGVYTVPRLEVDGEVVAPTVDWESTVETLDAAVE